MRARCVADDGTLLARSGHRDNRRHKVRSILAGNDQGLFVLHEGDE